MGGDAAGWDKRIAFPVDIPCIEAYNVSKLGVLGLTQSVALGIPDRESASTPVALVHASL